jgi:hypothetical protein
MLTQSQADILIDALKEAVRKEIFEWLADHRQDELFVTVERDNVFFILSLMRQPFEIRLHFRTKQDHIGLLRVDAAPYHPNPDGTEIRDTPHLHRYREGYGLQFAEPIDWYNQNDPIATLT